MAIKIQTHESNVAEGDYIVTIYEDDKLIADHENIGCEIILNANDTHSEAQVDSEELIQRIRNIVQTRIKEIL